jgi:uncharacterized protein YyaL (SSP411 family)
LPAAGALLRLGRLLGRADPEEDGARALRTFQSLLEQAPETFHRSLPALDFFQGPGVEVAIVDGQPVAYVCPDRACAAPVIDPADPARALAVLDATHGRTV